MPDERPPLTDAEYRLIRGPWPRWAYRLSLVSLALWAAAVVGACMAAALLVVALWPEI